MHGAPLSGPATLVIANTTISGNAANAGGGGIVNGFAFGEASFVTLANTTVTGNTAAFSGGGVFNRGTLDVEDSTVTYNVARSGAAISSDGVLTFHATPTTVGGNTATDYGAAIDNTGGTVTGGCPTTLGGQVVYSPANSPADFTGFSCPTPAAP